MPELDRPLLSWPALVAVSGCWLLIVVAAGMAWGAELLGPELELLTFDALGPLLTLHTATPPRALAWCGLALMVVAWRERGGFERERRVERNGWLVLTCLTLSMALGLARTLVFGDGDGVESLLWNVPTVVSFGVGAVGLGVYTVRVAGALRPRDDTYATIGLQHLVYGVVTTAFAMLVVLRLSDGRGQDRPHRLRGLAIAAAMVTTLGGSLTQFALGCSGMPRRYYAYLPEYQALHQASFVMWSQFVLAVCVGWATVIRVARRSQRSDGLDRLVADDLDALTR